MLLLFLISRNVVFELTILLNKLAKRYNLLFHSGVSDAVNWH